jgi:membrane protein implicated in regulation of membrane protease activity
VGILGRRQRILAWVGFLALAAHAPIVAWAKPGDTWMASVAVAAIVAFVIVIDDYYRRRPVSPPDPST